MAPVPAKVESNGAAKSTRGRGRPPKNAAVLTEGASATVKPKGRAKKTTASANGKSSPAKKIKVNDGEKSHENGKEIAAVVQPAKRGRKQNAAKTQAKAKKAAVSEDESDNDAEAGSDIDE